MYVCICAGLTEKHVKSVLADGARSTASVFRKLGHKVQCGKCVSMVRDMVHEHCVGDCGHCPRQAANEDTEPLPYYAAAE